jgi:hypothetical protein
MAMRQTLISHARSIVGASLLGLGAFVFYENLSQAAAQLSHLLAAIRSDAPGALPTAILAAWRVWQAYPPDQKRFLHVFVRHLLISSWPLLLVMAGTALSRDTFRPLPEKKNFAIVDLAARCSTSK